MGYDARVTFSLNRAALAAAAAASLLLAACGGTDTDQEAVPSPTDTATASAAPSGSPDASASPEVSPSAEASPTQTVTPSEDLSAITVTEGDVPEIEVPAPWAITETTTQVLKEGQSDQKLTDTSVVTIHYLGVNGRNGETFDGSYERGEPAVFPLDGVIPGFAKGLSGQTVGSRVLIGMPPEDGYPEGTPDGGIQPGDSLLFVVDIISANFETATGEEVAPAEGLPTVTMTDGAPTIAIADGVAAPAELQVQPLIKGPGAEVTPDSTIQVQYRSWKYSDGELLEDAWRAQAGPLSGLIDGWKEGLVGQTAGSRVMLVVPPALAYPDGRPDATPALEAGETLVYVIDLLDVQNQPAQ